MTYEQHLMFKFSAVYSAIRVGAVTIVFGLACCLEFLESKPAKRKEG